MMCLEVENKEIYKYAMEFFSFFLGGRGEEKGTFLGRGSFLLFHFFFNKILFPMYKI